MENAQVTLRMCASEGPGFKRYVKHFMMLSAKACVEFRLTQYHRHNTLNRRKVLTERIVIGGILDCYHRRATNTGMRISNGSPGDDFVTCLRRRARRYRAQASKQGGHFAAVILEGGSCELRFAAATRALERLEEQRSRSSRASNGARLQRLLLILGGPDGIPEQIRESLRQTLEKYTDFPLLGLALPGGTLHSYYALATVLVFHDQGLLLPFLEQQLGPPRPKLQPRPPAAPPPRHLVEAQKAELEEKEQTELPPAKPAGPLTLTPGPLSPGPLSPVRPVLVLTPKAPPGRPTQKQGVPFKAMPTTRTTRPQNDLAG